MKSLIRICSLFMLFLLASSSKSLNAQSQRVFRGSHTEYCCKDAYGTFTDCEDPDYSISYTITISNTEIRIARSHPNGKADAFMFRITGKKFCAPDNVWYFNVIDEDDDENIIGVSKNGDFLFVFDLYEEGDCVLVFYMHE